jgi:LSD1 subclass zinc finger protein
MFHLFMEEFMFLQKTLANVRLVKFFVLFLTLLVICTEVGQMVCGCCRELIAYHRGATHVQCFGCSTINLVLEGVYGL